MDFAVVHEKVNGVIPFNLRSQISEKWLKFFLSKWEICDFNIQESVTFADSSANGLTRLLACTIFNHYIRFLIWPRTFLVASGLEYTLIYEYEMTLFILNIFDFVPQLDRPLSMSIIYVLLHLWCWDSLDSLVRYSWWFHYMTKLSWLKHSIRKLAMKQLAALFQI